MPEVKSTKPLIAYGTFGLHINLCPTGKWAFVGTVPVQLKDVVRDTEDELKIEVFKWFHQLSCEDHNELLPLLRDDVYQDYRSWVMIFEQSDNEDH